MYLFNSKFNRFISSYNKLTLYLYSMYYLSKFSPKNFYSPILLLTLIILVTFLLFCKLSSFNICYYITISKFPTQLSASETKFYPYIFFRFFSILSNDILDDVALPLIFLFKLSISSFSCLFYSYNEAHLFRKLLF